MNIQDVDKNFLQNASFDKEKVDFYSVTESPFQLYGVFYDEKRGKYLRIPQEVADSVSEGVSFLNRHTSGGRVRFSTDSKNIVVLVDYGGLEIMPHMANSGCSGFALCYHDGDEERFCAGGYPSHTVQERFTWSATLPEGKGGEYTLYFPLYQGVKAVYIGLDKGATVGEGKAHKDIKPVLYYGSSITQGGCASRADTSYQGFICKRNNVSFINLGFCGNAKAEPQMIDYLAGIDCSVLVFDYDHNAPSVEYLQATHYRAYEQYRKKRPNVPIVFVSRPDHAFVEDTARRFAVIRETYERAKATGDENVYLIDGRTFFENERENSTVDGCHPTDLGFYQMSLKIGQTIDEILKNKNI